MHTIAQEQDLDVTAEADIARYVRLETELAQTIAKGQEQLQKERDAAVQLLLAKRQHIDEALSRIGYTSEQQPLKKRVAQRPRVCGNCNEPGHNRRNCPQSANPSTK